VAIARALATNPEVIILDEPISALDVSVRAQVINLLLDLQEQLGLAYVFVAHDLAIVRHMCHEVVVLYRGDVVERGSSEVVLATPGHPYTVALLEASYLKEHAGAADVNADTAGAGDTMRKVVEDSPVTGCRYRLRCPRASSVCEVEVPRLVVAGPGQEVACHHPVETLVGGRS
jgi:oligopeptide/dipeptide ABC transporter ATP-binding protein